ncbi:uncharacterized protein EAF01_010022 [Botrytis porri]|uniref:uncharacterized protein n=1 Tax=Botrytis porri TaxID=87229 RepID=UPI001901A06B|nr:uncharacterized protein EAF01_010022 [Botrytis porri]KAF7894571.1 hypothetical protein EAF01_010022 [Botrytis porri]
MSSPTFGCTDIPIVIRWGKSEPFNYIGTPAQQLRMNVDLGTQDNPKLLFWFSVTVGVTVSPGSATIRKKPLYFVLQASLFGEAGGITLAASPYKVSSKTRTAMQKAGIYMDGTTVSRIYFKLENNGTVFMPPIENHSFTPASDNVVKLLADLQSLSQAKNFCVYTSGQISTITQLWERIPHIHRGTFTGDFTTQNVYRSNMVCDVWTNFNQFARQGHPAKRQDPLLQDPQDSNLSSSHVLNQDLVDTDYDEESLTGRKRKYGKISSNTTPLDILGSNKSNVDHRSKVRFAKSCNNITDYLRKELSVFIFWTAEINPRLQEAYEQVFSDLGGAVSSGNITEFYKIKSECMADVCITYVKRESEGGSEWVLRNTI